MLKTNFVAETMSDIKIISEQLKENHVAFSTNDLEVTFISNLDDTNTIINGLLALIDKPIGCFVQREFSCSHMVVYYDLGKDELYDNAMVFLEVKFKASSHDEYNNIFSILKSFNIPFSSEDLTITFYTDRLSFAEIEKNFYLSMHKKPAYLSETLYKSCHSHNFLLLEEDSSNFEFIEAMPYVFTWSGHELKAEDRFSMELYTHVALEKDFVLKREAETGKAFFNMELHLDYGNYMMRTVRDDYHIAVEVVTLENHLASLPTETYFL